MKDYRELGFKAYGKVCSNEKCGYQEYEEALDVHHIDSNRSNNDISNLMVLCCNCHALVTRKVFIVKDRKLYPKKGS